MNIKTFLVPTIGLALALSPAFIGAASALTTSCVGTTAPSSITWTASSVGGVAPVSYVWGNSSTSTTQTISVVPGIYSMTLQATDASSTVATTTCTATLAQPAPTIVSFTATPGTVTLGQSALLSWSVTNASSTSINNGVGVVSSTSIAVTPSTTTTYQLSATNPTGTVTSNVTVVVNATSTNTSVQTRIQNLLTMIANLRAQLALLLIQQSNNNGNGGNTATSTPGSNACFNFNRNLYPGAKGDDVKELQKHLAKDSTIFPEGLITGFYGRKTEEAIKRYQRKYGIASTTTGLFDLQSRSYLNEHCNAVHDDDKNDAKENKKERDDHGNRGNGRGNSRDDD